MSITVVVGAQWGDEGKGKMVDYLSTKADLIARFQGGDNAGHTVINDFGVFKLHVIPCGIFNKDSYCLIGTGMVANPDILLGEMNELRAANVDVSKLRISAKAHILMPYHTRLDELMEQKGGIGTTKRGIGQAYAYRSLRKNLRYEDLLDLEEAKAKIESSLSQINSQISYFGGTPFTVEEIYNKCVEWADKLRDIIIDPVVFVHNMIDNNKNILFEGQLGVMKDLDLGIYPYVTSSNPTAAYAAVSAGFPAKKIDRVVGIAKAFSSAVGDGPFPTEMSKEESDALRGKGDKPDDEFGARTGRARRLGWLDIPILKFANQVNGFDDLALCKIDKLDDMKEIKICVAYELDGKVLDHMPTTKEMFKVKPVYKTMPGWLSSTKNIKKIADLPENAKKYIGEVEKLVGAPVTFVGIGPGRDDVAI